MCFLLQMLLFLGASFTAWMLSGVFHAPLWAGGIGGLIFLLVAWIGYLFYQASHPDWWAPWDDGLPQEMRMVNAFVPVVAIFLLALILLPTFSAARQKAMARKARIEQKRLKASPAPIHVQPSTNGG